MAEYVEVLARDWKVTADGLEIKNLESISFDSSVKEADITSFSNAGNNAHIVTSRGYAVKIGGFYTESSTSKSPEPGLAALISLSESIGNAAMGDFIMTSPSGVTREFSASVTMDSLGGGKDDPTKWSAVLKVSGGIIKGTTGA